jgi:hypothetical protein
LKNLFITPLLTAFSALIRKISTLFSTHIGLSKDSPNEYFKNTRAPLLRCHFNSQHTNKEREEYDKTSEKMVALAQKMPEFLGVESVRDETGFGITSVYWKDKISIKAWRNHSEHKKAKKR